LAFMQARNWASGPDPGVEESANEEAAPTVDTRAGSTHASTTRRLTTIQD